MSDSKEELMSLSKAVEYARQKGVLITTRALRFAIANGRLNAQEVGSFYVTTQGDMDIFLLRRRRKNTRTGA